MLRLRLGEAHRGGKHSRTGLAGKWNASSLMPSTLDNAWYAWYYAWYAGNGLIIGWLIIWLVIFAKQLSKDKNA